MARAQFDREQVLGEATRLFWQQGFNGASMQQVVKATGLNPGSLYLAFGNKERLFEETLGHYAQQSKDTIRQTLESAPSVGTGICQILLQKVEESQQRDYCSCFLIKSQLELAALGNDSLRPIITTYLAQIEELYASYLRREHPPKLASEYASSLMMQLFGLGIYGYQQRSSAHLIAALKLGLPWLQWE